MGWAELTRTAAVRIGIDIGSFEKLAADEGKDKTVQELAKATRPDAALVGDSDFLFRVLVGHRRKRV